MGGMCKVAVSECTEAPWGSWSGNSRRRRGLAACARPGPAHGEGQAGTEACVLAHLCVGSLGVGSIQLLGGVSQSM